MSITIMLTRKERVKALLDKKAGLIRFCRSVVLILGVIFMSACSNKTVAQAANECPKGVPQPYTDALIIESKYDQSDSTKSKLKAKQDPKAKEIKQRIDGYTKGLVKFSEYLLSDSEKKQQLAVTCIHSWLTAWASEDALLTDEVSKTGRAVRKWALASINSMIIKSSVMSQNQFKLNQTETDWIAKLAAKVVEDYDVRLKTDFKYFNNHDHWAAWAVFSSGYITKNRELTDWAFESFNKSLSLAKTNYRGQYAYFPIEVARSKLAVNYSHFSLTPLVLLEHYLPKAGYKVMPEQSKTLSQLVSFAVVSTLSPETFSELLSAKQAKVERYKLAWLIPYLSNHKDHVLARKLYQKYEGKVDGYSLIGGRVQPLYEG